MRNRGCAQFSIFKIDYKEVGKQHTVELDESSTTFSRDMCIFLIKAIEKRLGDRAETRKMEKENIIGIMYKPYNPFREEKASYVIFYMDGRDIYAMTSGDGDQVIRKYAEKNWGMHLLADSLRNIKEGSKTGSAEAVEMKGVLLKDSILMEGAFSSAELKMVVGRLKELAQDPDEFSQGHFVQAKTLGIKPAELLNELIEGLICGSVEDFLLVDEECVMDRSTVAEYRIAMENGETYYSAPELITMEMLFNAFAMDRTKISKIFLKTVLKKWTISAYNSEGEVVVAPSELYSSMLGTLRIGDDKKTYYLFKGKWYVYAEGRPH